MPNMENKQRNEVMRDGERSSLMRIVRLSSGLRIVDAYSDSLGEDEAAMRVRGMI